MYMKESNSKKWKSNFCKKFIKKRLYPVLYDTLFMLIEKPQLHLACVSLTSITHIRKIMLSEELSAIVQAGPQGMFSNYIILYYTYM